MGSLLERLGRPADARLVVMVCDGLGSSNAANNAIHEALRTGIATTASLQVPCPWARGAAANHRGDDVGVSLTVNAQFEVYRWGPITYAPSLLGGDGGFPQTPADVWEHADVDEVRRECRAQLERAVLWGFDPSHLSAHLNTLCARP
ncbi:MAG: ChbG/HpnK family deacetylase, partial [Actinomycetia bacterium]|nr:ChbG/HpnK family deacetylase [Actinomycetes bacterium]